MACKHGFKDYYDRPCYSAIPCKCWSCQRVSCTGCKFGCVWGHDKGSVGEGSLSMAATCVSSICDDTGE